MPSWNTGQYQHLWPLPGRGCSSDTGVFNTLMDRVGVRRSLVERVVNRALALPVSHFLRLKRGISLPVLDRQGDGVGDIGWGTYQSPILIQWKGSGISTRALNVRLVRFV